MTSSRILAFSLLALSTVAVSPTLLAAGQSPTRQACAADIKRLCADIQPGGGRIKQCMKSHSDEVSPDCKTAMLNAKSAKQAQRQAAPPPAQ